MTTPMTAPKTDSPASNLKNSLPKNSALNWLLGLAVLYTIYFAKTLLMPVLVALMFALLLSPLVKILKRYYVPRSVSAVLLLLLIGGPFTLLSSELAEPAQKWAERIPELTEKMSKELNTFSDSVTGKAKAKKEKSFFSFLKSDDEPAPTDNNSLSERLTQGGLELILSVLSATPAVIGQLLTFLILVLFLMIFGPHLFRHSVEVLPQISNKQYATELVEKIQLGLSRYILTVSLINAGLGAVTASVLALMGVEDALLWGVLVGLLNFAPYLGPLISVCILAIAGVAQYDMSWSAILPAGVYFAINMIEAQFVTPLVLGRRMRLNPLVLMLWLVIWGWLWGFVGVLLSVPLLVCLKLIADELNALKPWVAMIEAPA